MKNGLLHGVNGLAVVKQSAQDMIELQSELQESHALPYAHSLADRRHSVFSWNLECCAQGLRSTCTFNTACIISLPTLCTNHWFAMHFFR